MTDVTNSTPAPRTGSFRGTWAVLLLLTLALTLVWIGYKYRIRPTAPASDKSPANSAASSTPTQTPAPFNTKFAQQELDALQQRVMLLIGQRRATRAVDDVRALVDRFPDFAPARNLLGQVLLSAQRSPEALEQLRHSLTLDPAQPEVHRLAGNVALQLKQYDVALTHFVAASQLRPDNLDDRLFIAQTYSEQQRFDEARAVLALILKTNATYHPAYHALSGIEAQQGQLQLALNRADQAMEYAPKDKPRTLVIYGRWKAKLLRRDNRPQDALYVLSNLPPEQTQYHELLEDMATTWGMLNQPEQAAQMYEKESLLRPTDPQLLGQAAQWRAKHGDMDRAREYLARLKRTAPDYPGLADLQKLILGDPNAASSAAAVDPSPSNR